MLRSILFVPGSDAGKIAKVFGRGADAVIIDLEDAVAIAEKARARLLVSETLETPGAEQPYVRINALDTPYAYSDIAAVVGPRLRGLVVPKIDGPHQVATLHWLLTNLEAERQLRKDAIDLIPIVETAAGMLNIDLTLRDAPPRLRRVMFGAADLANDLRISWDRDESELHPYRQRVVQASMAAGLEPPIDLVWGNLNDEDGLRQSAMRGRALGFQGKLCIHPKQVGVVNDAFSPGHD